VLVHGIASSTANWDFTPTWSTARALASAGCVVYSYDHLGYAESPYLDVPGDGYTLTTCEHRRMLQEVVDAVKSGVYSTTAGADCTGARQPGGMPNRTVVIAGHSAGGWIVAGYPGACAQSLHTSRAFLNTSRGRPEGVGSIDPDNPGPESPPPRASPKTVARHTRFVHQGAHH
jgi:alpha-beta hydrolase superfamily lysophospholipase